VDNRELPPVMLVNWDYPMFRFAVGRNAMLAKWMAVLAALGFMVFGSAAWACDYCGRDAGYCGGGEIYSCNEGRYDCHYENNWYRPRYDGCGDGCHVYRGCHDGCRNSYREGFRDGFVTAQTGGEDRGFFDDSHRWHDWQRWQDHDGGYHDGWRGDDGHWHDRSEWHGGDHHDGDRHDGDDHHDGVHDGEHHDADHHDGDHFDHHDDGH